LTIVSIETTQNTQTIYMKLFKLYSFRMIGFSNSKLDGERMFPKACITS
jgi:hypothetical protein